MSTRAMWLLSALVVSACGLQEPDAQTARIDPGKGPFVEVGAVEVCAGSALVVPLSRGGDAIGLCVDGAPVACTTSSDCDRGGRCVCGACVVAACASEAECRDGELCRSGACAKGCMVDAECERGDRCDKGACRRPCATSADCAPGASCDTLDGVCLAATCAPGTSCSNGRTCRPARAPLDLREPAWLGTSDDAIVVEARRGSTSDVVRATRTSRTRYALADMPIARGASAPAVLSVDGRVVSLITARADKSGLDLRAADDALGNAFGAPRELLRDADVDSPAVAAFRGQTWVAWVKGRDEIRFATLVDGALVPVALPSITRAMVRGVRDVSQVSAPALLARDALLIYVTVRGVEGEAAIEQGTVLPADANDSVALFATFDGVRLDAAAAPIVARRANLRTYLGEREPSVRVVGGRAELLFVAGDAAGVSDGLALLEEPSR